MNFFKLNKILTPKSGKFTKIVKLKYFVDLKIMLFIRNPNIS